MGKTGKKGIGGEEETLFMKILGNKWKKCYEVNSNQNRTIAVKFGILEVLHHVTYQSKATVMTNISE